MIPDTGVQPSAVALLAVAIASAGLGIVAYTRARTRASNQMWVVHASLVTVWALLSYLIITSQDLMLTTLSLRLAHLVSAFVLVTFVDFCWVFPERLTPDPGRPRRALYLSAFVVGGIASLPPLISDIELTPTGPNVIFGWPLSVLGAYIVALLVHADRVLWLKSRQLNGVARVQTVYVLLGAVGFQVLIFLMNVVLPVVTGSTEFARWGVVTYFFTIVTVTVAIAKHSLWDLNTAGRRAAAAVLTIASLTGIAAPIILMLVVWRPLRLDDPLKPVILWTVFGCTLGVLMAPIYNWFRGLLTRSLSDDPERMGRLVSALGEAIVHLPDHGPVLATLLERIQSFFGVTFVRAYLRAGDGRYMPAGIVEKYPHYEQPIGGNDAHLADYIVDALRLQEVTGPLYAGQLMRFDTHEGASSRLRVMEHMRASVVLPLRWKDEPIGLIVFGSKISRDLFSTSEIELLKSVGAQASIAVRNAELRAEIVAEKERTEKVITQMDSGVVAIDAACVIGVINPSACLLMNLEQDKVLGRRTDVLPAALRDRLERALETGETILGESLHLKGDSQTRVALSTFVLKGTQDAIEGAGVVIRDLRTEDALQRSEREAERLRFVRSISAGMAHEIRNPLVAIRTFAELAPARLDDPEFRESFLKVAQSEVGRLEELVSQFMTLAKPTRLVRDPVAIEQLIADAVSAASAGADSKEIGIGTINNAADFELRGDDARLHQVLANLLLNAIDATPTGGKIEVRLEDGPSLDGESRELLVSVWNSGSYIPPEDQDRLFEPFYTTKAAGTGLGLAICHTIAEEHGGRIIVQSDEKSGTAFTMALPLSPDHERHTLNTS